MRPNAYEIGSRFGRLTLIANDVPPMRPLKRARRFGMFRCDCGNAKPISYESLPHIQGCGCVIIERIGALRRTHGQTKHPLHGVYRAMVSRCNNPKVSTYKHYGARGIRVAPEWARFEDFFAWAEPRWTPGLTLDRTDNGKGYSPDNCRFVTMREQNRNTRANRIVECRGRLVTLAEAEEITGLSKHHVRRRVEMGAPL